jgi:DNA-binding MarR family transcriptional regulator
MTQPTLEGSISREALASLRQTHIGALFLQAHRSYAARALQRLHASGYLDLTNSLTLALASIDLDGTHLTALAERLNVTKQAAGQLVDDLQSKGYLQRTPDPDDRRATLIKFTDKGWRFLQDAHRIKHEIEADYSTILGEVGLNQLRDLLQQLITPPGSG